MEPGSDVPPAGKLVQSGDASLLGCLVLSLKAGPGGWQLTALHGCAAEGKWLCSPQARALGGQDPGSSHYVLGCSHPHPSRHAENIEERAKHTWAPHTAICCWCWLAPSLLPLGDTV